MLTFKKILFPTDFSRCSDQALIRALSLAQLYSAELHIVHVLLPLEYDPNSLSHRTDLKKMQDEIDQLSTQQMRLAVPKPRVEDLAIVQATIRGISAAPAILEYAASHDIDLIVMGTHGRRGLNHLMLGSVAEEAVRLAPCPVMTIREVRNPMLPQEDIQILVPVDFSGFSREALSYAKYLAADLHGSLRLLHVIEETIHPSFYVTGQTSLSAWYPELEANAISEMKRLVAEAKGPNVPMEFHVKEGRAVVDIVTFAKKYSIALIVMASHGLTGIEHLLLGSVAEKVVRMAPCPTFVVKSFGKSVLTAPATVLGTENLP